MNRHMTKMLGILLCLLPVLTWAERGDLPVRTSGIFAGAGLGLGQATLDTEFGDLDGQEFSFKLFAGYRWWNTFMPWDIDLGFEAGYVDLGSREQDLDDTVWKMTNKGMLADLTGYLPIARNLDLIGKAGLFFSDTKLSNKSIDIPECSDSSTDLSLGIGVGYQAAGGFGARAELESFGTVSGAWLLSLSATYQFK